MPSVVHVVATANFAGAERYVASVAPVLADRGWRVAAVGGDPTAMPRALGDAVEWHPGANIAQSALALTRIGPFDVCHVHMTHAEAVAVATRRWHRGSIVATRHFASRRGSSVAGRVASRWIAPQVRREIAISRHVAAELERPPDAIVLHGVPVSGPLWREASRRVLVLQRLEPEKDTLTALRAWETTRLVDRGWTLRIVGEGSRGESLRRYVDDRDLRGVEFRPWVEDVSAEFAAAAMLVAPTPNEAFGLTVAEAMMAAVPVVASAAGGHLETIGRALPGALFRPGDAHAAATALARLEEDHVRADASRRVRELALSELSISRHVDLLLEQYFYAFGSS